MNESIVNVPAEFPVIAVRGNILFPHAVLPVTVPENELTRVLEGAKEPVLVAVVAQRDPEKPELDVSDLAEIGTAGAVIRTARLNDERIVAFVHGIERVRIREVVQRAPFLVVRVDSVADVVPATEDPEYLALKRNVVDLFHEIVKASPNLPDDLALMMRNIHDASMLSDLVASAMSFLSRDAAQGLLETTDVRARMRRLIEELLKERQDLQLRDKIREEVAGKVGAAQRQFFLREQLAAIRKELGETDDEGRDLTELKARIEQAHLPDEVAKEAARELERLPRIPSASPEYSVARTYLDWLVTLPWTHSTELAIDIGQATRILDEDHYGLEKVKERILEFLAIHALKSDLRSPILCFVGPPGVGKTSLGKSIARATGRSFVRISLGGVHDEAEIRGHRRTYVGALPGQVIRGIRRAGTNNPVFMLDEIDKLGKDFRGDPSDALLEVLDPEQNATFRDHYLDLAFDLSHVLFITTANVLDPVPPALRDRMETIELPGYSDEEKIHIAERYLVLKQVAANGLRSEQLRFTEAGLYAIIHGYAHEAGVRALERNIAAICRKRARQIIGDGSGVLVVTEETVRSFLGVPRYRVETELAERTRAPGVAVAVAWTPYGGDILFIETARARREKGELIITGQVREVMQESAKTALSWLRANAERYGLEPAEFNDYDVHLHVPEGAVPKDGPSAGLAIAAALLSLFTRKPVRPHLAMTGEITLTGALLPVGGIKNKVLAARRSGVREMILPAANEPNVLEEISKELRADLLFHFVATVPAALSIAFEQETDVAARQHALES